MNIYTTPDVWITYVVGSYLEVIDIIRTFLSETYGSKYIYNEIILYLLLVV